MGNGGPAIHAMYKMTKELKLKTFLHNTKRWIWYDKFKTKDDQGL